MDGSTDGGVVALEIDSSARRKGLMYMVGTVAKEATCEATVVLHVLGEAGAGETTLVEFEGGGPIVAFCEGAIEDDCVGLDIAIAANSDSIKGLVFSIQANAIGIGVVAEVSNREKLEPRFGARFYSMNKLEWRCELPFEATGDLINHTCFSVM